jgi:exportin-1
MTHTYIGSNRLWLPLIFCTHLHMQVPLGYIFETSLIPLLIQKFFPVPIFRNATIECLTEIAGLSDCPEQYNSVRVYILPTLLSVETCLCQVLR